MSDLIDRQAAVDAINGMPSVTPNQFADCDKMVCEDAVSREAVLNGKVLHYSNDGCEIISGEAVPVEYIQRLPSVTPKPKTGKWVPFLLPCVDGTAMHVWQCDQCETNQVIESNYCPDCGSYNGGDTNA